MVRNRKGETLRQVKGGSPYRVTDEMPCLVKDEVPCQVQGRRPAQLYVVATYNWVLSVTEFLKRSLWRAGKEETLLQIKEKII